MLGDYDQKLALGGWYYTANFNDLSETQPNGSRCDTTVPAASMC